LSSIISISIFFFLLSDNQELNKLFKIVDFSNKNQQNIDGDALGDACDEDMDNDALLNAADNCPGTMNADQADADRDGVGDLCDNCPSTFNPLQEDVNHNLIGKHNLFFQSFYSRETFSLNNPNQHEYQL
jgi:hypothetical protein